MSNTKLHLLLYTNILYYECIIEFILKTIFMKLNLMHKPHYFIIFNILDNKYTRFIQKLTKCDKRTSNSFYNINVEKLLNDLTLVFIIKIITLFKEICITL